MTLILELPADVEAQLRAEAQARGVTPEAVVLESVSAKYEKAETKAERRARITRLLEESRRQLEPLAFSLDDFLAEKHEDIARENAKWERLGE